MRTPLLATATLTLLAGLTLLGPQRLNANAHAAESQSAIEDSHHEYDHDHRHALLLTDFTEPERNVRWRVVNDNVMGGRSDGFMAIDPDAPGVLVMTGDINTNGGGFTSIRMGVDPDMFETPTDPDTPSASTVFSELHAVRLRVRADAESMGKPFAVRLEDSVRRPRSVNFRAVLQLDRTLPPEQWQTITVPVDDMRPIHHGRQLDPSEWAPLDTSCLNRVGVILNNVDDGPYRFEIERIELLH